MTQFASSIKDARAGQVSRQIEIFSLPPRDHYKIHNALSRFALARSACVSLKVSSDAYSQWSGRAGGSGHGVIKIINQPASSSSSLGVFPTPLASSRAVIISRRRGQIMKNRHPAYVLVSEICVREFGGFLNKKSWRGGSTHTRVSCAWWILGKPINCRIDRGWPTL